MTSSRLRAGAGALAVLVLGTLGWLLFAGRGEIPGPEAERGPAASIRSKVSQSETVIHGGGRGPGLPAGAGAADPAGPDVAQ